MQTTTVRLPKYLGLGGLNLLAFILILAIIQAATRRTAGSPLASAILALIALAWYPGGVRLIERRSIDELTARRAPSELAFGLVLGVGLFSVVMLVLWILGVFQPAGWGSAGVLAAGLLTALLGATVEEILFRGLLFRLSAKVIGTWGAIALTALFFGFAHAANKGATLWSSVAIVLEAGVLLGAAYAATRRLWLPIGLHIGWNYAEGSIYGMSVSGGTARPSLVHGALHGSTILTGGQFGPEASIVAVIVCLVPASVLLAFTTLKGRIELPAWRDSERSGRGGGNGTSGHQLFAPEVNPQVQTLQSDRTE